MLRALRKLWSYLGASANAKIDEKADPKVQIEQAIDTAKRQHQALSQQAAAVIGNQRQVEMRLARSESEVERLQASARQAIILSDQARANGDEKKAGEYEQTALALATQLTSAEQGLEDLKTLHSQTENASAQAKAAVEQNAMMLQEKVAERTRLLTQLESAKMQEKVAEALTSMGALQPAANTPSMDEIREKIEGRYAKALGSAELASNSMEGRMMEVQQASLNAGASARLDQIRASLNPTAAPAAVEPAPLADVTRIDTKKRQADTA